MTALLDANVLIALADADHAHHPAAREWVRGAATFATCPVTQGALVRFLLRLGASASQAGAVARGVTSSPRHEFWADDLSYDAVDLRGVVGHRQVTDAYLAGLARHHGGRLATFDRALASLHPDVVDLIGA